MSRSANESNRSSATPLNASLNHLTLACIQSHFDQLRLRVSEINELTTTMWLHHGTLRVLFIQPKAHGHGTALRNIKQGCYVCVYIYILYVSMYMCLYAGKKTLCNMKSDSVFVRLTF